MIFEHFRIHEEMLIINSYKPIDKSETLITTSGEKNQH